MLIYVKILKLPKYLKYFTGGCLHAPSTQPVNILEIEQKFSTLKQSVEFQNKPAQ